MSGIDGVGRVKWQACWWGTWQAAGPWRRGQVRVWGGSIGRRWLGQAVHARSVR